jgi:excinuclease ABC subunit B
MIVDSHRLGAGEQAAEIAAVLTERGLGGDSVDLDSRLDQFRRDRSPRAGSARSLAQRWASQVAASESATAKSADVGNVGAIGPSSPSPLAGEGRGGGSASRGASRVHKPHLDEMHGPESVPFRPGRTSPRRSSGDDVEQNTGSKIFQPTDSRQSGPEFGPTPRSTGGAPGHRGGWKKR